MRSRVQGPTRVLTELRRLMLKTIRMAEGRELTKDQQTWAHHVLERLEGLITEGDQVLPAFRDPREMKRARKSPGRLF